MLYKYMGEKWVDNKQKSNVFWEKRNSLDRKLRTRCEKINYGSLLDKLVCLSEEERELAKDMLSKMEKIVRDPLSYYGDLHAAIFLAYLHNNPKKDSFSLQTGNILEDKEKNPEKYELLKQFELQKSEIYSVWNSNDKKFDKDDIRWNYIKFFDVKEEGEEEDCKIISVPGGCFLYHFTLISKEHMGLWDVEKNTEDYKRYGFGKSQRIYENLKYGPVENRLLMEYTLGIGYLNKLYPYIKHFDKREDIEKTLEIVEISVKNIPFFLRGEITDVIWSYIIWDGVWESRIENVKKVLLEIKDSVLKIYQDTLKQWWNIFWKYADKEEWYRIELRLQQIWEQYFVEEKVYSDWIETLKIQDWRGITNVEDCFVIIENLDTMKKRETLSFSELPKMILERIEDRKGAERYLYVEAPLNKIGEKVLEKTVEEFSKICFPQKDEDLHKEYYNIRKEEFCKLKRKEEIEFAKKEIKIKEGWGKLKPEQVYAWLHKYVIQWLIEMKLNEDE